MVYGTKVEIRGVGRLRARERTDRHEAKSRAGKMFHNDAVRSVCVYDEAGTVALYLRKGVNGVIRRESE